MGLPMFASEKTAARLLDMTPSEFRTLVEKGSLPGPKKIAEHKRWSTRELEAIISGEAMEEDFEW